MKRSYRYWALFFVVIVTALSQNAWSQDKKNIVI
jgi:hypothetical protein